MSGADAFGGADGSTPLRDEEIAGLIPTWVATREDLNRAEYTNVLRGVAWAGLQASSRAPGRLLTTSAVKRLHREMFGEVWRWAGTYRRHDTNIGNAWTEVPLAVQQILDDVSHQVTHLDELPWDRDEVAVRFHYRLVAVHPFSNGNGRHARLAADCLVQAMGGQPFTWGRQELGVEGSARREYLAALRTADKSQDIGPLLRFARR